MTERIEALLREAAEWRLIGLLFECPSEGWRAQIRALGAEVKDPELRRAAELADREASEGVYHSILGPGGPAPAREVSYHLTIQLGYLMSELCIYYDAFAYRPVTEEAIDHISVEAGFAGFLRVKQAFSLSNGEDESAELAAAAAESFRSNHLVYVAQPLAETLSQSGVEYLESAGKALLARVGPCPVLPVIASSEVFASDSVECATGA